MTITSLSFAFVQYTSTAATADARAAAPAPTPAPQPVAKDSCHGGGCDSPRRSPLFRALKDALLEMTREQPAAASSTASTAAATSTTAGTAQATPSAETTAALAAAPDLEHAMMDFARALMQALRSGFQQGRGDDGEHEGRGRHHHHHHHGHRGWGDPAQRVDGLAQRVGAAPAPGMPAPDTSVAPTPTPGSAMAPAAPASAATPAPAPTDDVTSEPVTAGATAAAAGSRNAVIFVASINIQQTAAAAPASSFGTLLNAFAGLQQAMGKPVSGDSLRSELSAFLESLAQRLRGEDPATAEATTRPGALLSVAA